MAEEVGASIKKEKREVEERGKITEKEAKSQGKSTIGPHRTCTAMGLE